MKGIRIPDFVSKSDFKWAVSEASDKKKTDFSKVEFLTYDEGLCVQCIHIDSYDNEPGQYSSCTSLRIAKDTLLIFRTKDFITKFIYPTQDASLLKS